MKGRKKNYIVSQDVKNRISLKMKGRKLTDETKNKMRLTHLKLGTRPPATPFGEKHPNWKGGKSFEPYPKSWTETLKRSIRERDGYTCKLCGKNQIEELEKLNRKLAVHHIDYNKENCNPKNLVTLCHICHIGTNFERDYWTNYFIICQQHRN